MSFKLSDKQRELLRAAAEREDRLLAIPSQLKGAAAQKVAAKLIAASLAKEVKAKAGAPVWRRDAETEQPVKTAENGRDIVSARRGENASATSLGKEARIRPTASQFRMLSQILNSWWRTQSCETSLRGSNSLFTGKRTGNLSNFARFRGNSPLKSSDCQCVTRKFPANPNREFISTNRQFFSPNTEFWITEQGRAGQAFEWRAGRPFSAGAAPPCPSRRRFPFLNARQSFTLSGGSTR